MLVVSTGHKLWDKKQNPQNGYASIFFYSKKIQTQQICVQYHIITYMYNFTIVFIYNFRTPFILTCDTRTEKSSQNNFL